MLRAMRVMPLAFSIALMFVIAAPPAARAADADSTRIAAHVATLETTRGGLLRADRLQHASLSFTLAAAAGLCGRARGEAVAFSFTLGFAKELHDGRRGRFDPIDLAADAIGATLGALAAARR
jgi:hypothetical protein